METPNLPRVPAMNDLALVTRLTEPTATNEEARKLAAPEAEIARRANDRRRRQLRRKTLGKIDAARKPR
jgi:hypothetical protein